MNVELGSPEPVSSSETVGVYARIRPKATKKNEPSPEIVVKRRFNQQKSIQARNLEFSLDCACPKSSNSVDGEP